MSSWSINHKTSSFWSLCLPFGQPGRLARTYQGRDLKKPGQQCFFKSSRSLRKWWLDRRYRRPSDDDASLPQWENDYWLDQEPEFRMFYEYLDMGKIRYVFV